MIFLAVALMAAAAWVPVSALLTPRDKRGDDLAEATNFVWLTVAGWAVIAGIVLVQFFSLL